MITRTIGICFMIFGVVWSIFDRHSCKFSCKTCTNQQLSPCFLLFLFVGIIFIIVGFSLTTIQQILLPKIGFKDKEEPGVKIS